MQQCTLLPDEIKTAYLELKSTILGGRVLCARTPDGIERPWGLAVSALRSLLAPDLPRARARRSSTDPPQCA